MEDSGRERAQKGMQLIVTPLNTIQEQAKEGRRGGGMEGWDIRQHHGHNGKVVVVVVVLGRCIHEGKLRKK